MEEKKWYICTSGVECMYFAVELTAEELEGVKKFCKAQFAKENRLHGRILGCSGVNCVGYNTMEDARDGFLKRG